MKFPGAICLAIVAALCGCGRSEQERFYERANKRLDAAEKRESDNAVRSSVLSDAKKVGLAAIMAAGDQNDVFPGPADFATKLRAVMRPQERALLGETTWVFAGGSATAIQNPNSTALCRLARKGAVATVFADGSARLEGKQP